MRGKRNYRFKGDDLQRVRQAELSKKPNMSGGRRFIASDELMRRDCARTRYSEREAGKRVSAGNAIYMSVVNNTAKVNYVKRSASERPSAGYFIRTYLLHPHANPAVYI